MRFLILALSILLIGCTAYADDHSTKNDWMSSRYGESDRLGAVNNLSPKKTAKAARLIRKGKTFALGMSINKDTPAYGPRNYDLTILQLSDGSGTPLGANQATGNDDLVRTFLGIGSQIDGLGHMGINHYYYNGVHVSDFVATEGLRQFSTHSIPPIATRGILLDMTKLFGYPVPDGTAFNRKEIKRAAKLAGVTIEKGDVVIFHTGKLSATKNDTSLAATLPGVGVEGAQYLADLGVVAVGADTWGLEVIPFEDPTKFFDVHLTLLAKNGVYILENMVTDELAADGDGEFFFTLGIPRLEGTVQAIINPIAIR